MVVGQGDAAFFELYSNILVEYKPLRLERCENYSLALGLMATTSEPIEVEIWC